MSIDKEYERVFNLMNESVDGEPIPMIISGALNVIGVMLAYAKDEESVRLLAYDCYRAITHMADEVIQDIEHHEKAKRH